MELVSQEKLQGNLINYLISPDDEVITFASETRPVYR